VKNLLWLALLLVFLPRAHAACTQSITSGMNASQLQTAIDSCSSGSTASFPAGTYSIGSTVTIPCGVSLSGPAVPYSQTHNQTAILSAASGFVGPAFENTGCSTAQSVEYLEWNGERPTNGGQFLQLEPGTANFTVNNNYIHGNQCNGGDVGQSNQCSLVQIYGTSSSTGTNNIYIQWNIFGVSGDCSVAMNDTNSLENADGGLCNGVMLGGQEANTYVEYNIFHYQEQGMKWLESSSGNAGYANPVYVDHNDYSEFSRIGYETQANGPGATSSQPTYMYIRYNDFHDRFTPGVSTYDLSAANGCKDGQANEPQSNVPNCFQDVSFNVDIGNNTSGADQGIEFWGGYGASASNPSTGNYNLIQGASNMFNGITWSKTGQFQFNSNNFQMAIGTTYPNQNCQTGSSGYWNIETSNTGNPPPNLPSCSNNTFSTTHSTQTSASPSLSPAAGSYSSGQVVTITTTGANRDLNTSNWCTTDGSTPVPGSGTATIMTSYTLTSNTTLKCVGMWGAANQPYSYATGYGYAASSPITEVYTVSGSNPTVTSGYLGDTGSVNTLAVGAAAIQFTAYVYYSNDTGPAALPDSYGNTAVWSSSNSSILSVGSTGLVSCVTTGSANVQANVNSASGLRLNVWTMTCTAAGPTITGGYLGDPGSVNTVPVNAGPIQFTAYVTYSNNTQGTLPDSYGNKAVWSSSNSSILSVGSTGLVSCIAAGSANVQVNVNTSTGLRLNVWTMTCTTPADPTITSGYLGDPGSVNTLTVGASPIQFSAYVYYSNNTGPATLPDSYGNFAVWSSSNSAVLAVGSTGLVSCTTAGTANVQVNVNTSSGFRLNVWTMTCNN
jgi:hypothetical protein